MMDTARCNHERESLNSIIANALNVDSKSILVRQVSKAILEIAEKSSGTEEIAGVPRPSQRISLLTAPFHDVICLRQESEKRQLSPFTKIEKICEDLEFGELIIKVQNGKPVFLESVKKQVKIN